MTDTTDGEGVYRKTATIKATQWFKMGDHPAVVLKSARNRYADEGVPWVDTLEGGHVVTPGDWIATGVQGEHWPIKPDVFAATYAEVSEPSTTDPVSPLTAALHPKTTDLVNSFAIALAHKLLGAEEKYGYSDGWLTDDWEDKCRADLLAHVHKGDPLDVAAYAAFCWARNWSTAQPLATAQTDGIKDPFLREVQKQLRAKDRLAAQPSAGAQGEYLTVPREPTEEILEAAHHCLAGDGDVADLYRAMTAVASSKALVEGMGEAIPCQSCSGSTRTWFAPDDLWNKVVSSPNGMLCPNCFIDMAERQGLKPVWQIGPAQPDTGDVAALREVARMREVAADWRRPALAQIEGPNDLKIYGGTIADDIDRWADILAALSKPNAPGAA